MRRIYAFTLVLVALSIWQIAPAQLNLLWEELGPNNQGDHIRALTVDNSGNVWAGATGGGLWRSTNGGVTWSQVTSLSEHLGVTSIAASGNNIYVGTGETYFQQPTTDFIPQSAQWEAADATTFEHGFFQYTGMVGEGVFVSNDGGNTWSHNNGTWNSSSSIYNNPFVSIQKISTNGSRTFIATLEGLYYSDNADLSNVTKANGSTEFMDNPVVDVEFADNGVVFAATKDSLYRSTDGGINFGSRINGDLEPTSPLAGNQVGGIRIEIAVAPSNPSVLYVAGALGTNQSGSGVWQSTDNGVSWTRIAPKESSTFQPLQGNGRYSLVLEVSPTDPLAIFYGGEKLYKYTDANGWDDGASHSFTPGFSTRYVPTPMLALAFDPNSDSTFYIGTDEELVGTDDFGDSYTFRTKGLNVASLTAVEGAVDYSVLASGVYRGTLFKQNANPDPSQQQWNGVFQLGTNGVGRFVTTNPDYLIVQGNDGGLQRSFNRGGAFESFYGFPLPYDTSCLGTTGTIIDRTSPTAEGGGLQDNSVAPVNPWILDEYIPANRLGDDSLIQNTPIYIYMASGSFVWVCSNPFGGLDSLPRWNRLTLDITNDGLLAAPEYITALDVSGDSDHTVIVGTNFGNVFRIDNANDPSNTAPCNDVVRLDTATANLPDAWISDIAFDKGNPDNVVITFGGYAELNERVWITNNAKANTTVPVFRNITGSLPTNLPVYTAAFHPDPSNTVLLVGTEKGVYTTSDDYTSATNLSWTNESGIIGNARVNDLNFRMYNISDWASDDYSYGIDWTLFAATDGRGAYVSKTLVSNDRPTIVDAGIHLEVGPNPADKMATVFMELPEPTEVTMKVYDLNGNLIRVLADRKYTAGNHSVILETAQLPSGVYLISTDFATSKSLFSETVRAVVTH